jgi:hypothetical protein
MERTKRRTVVVVVIVVALKGIISVSATCHCSPWSADSIFHGRVLRNNPRGDEATMERSRASAIRRLICERSESLVTTRDRSKGGTGRVRQFFPLAAIMDSFVLWPVSRSSITPDSIKRGNAASRKKGLDTCPSILGLSLADDPLDPNCSDPSDRRLPAVRT